MCPGAGADEWADCTPASCQGLCAALSADLPPRTGLGNAPRAEDQDVLFSLLAASIQRKEPGWHARQPHCWSCIWHCKASTV